MRSQTEFLLNVTRSSERVYLTIEEEEEKKHHSPLFAEENGGLLSL